MSISGDPCSWMIVAHAKAWYLWRIVQHEIHLILNSGTHWLIILTRVTLGVYLLSEVGTINMCKAMCCTQQAILSLVHVCSVNSKCTLTSLFSHQLCRVYSREDVQEPGLLWALFNNLYWYIHFLGGCFICDNLGQ